ncbi:MAG: UDP-N-acetylmuramoyl-tripeptide--D-alanyl-D-alanine ligase [Acidobacteria bacterium]|nr:UDP-N-acetylmuramoyl-tripeptide--D-alanyl-D-alanine ligase [Acidobacteriota bacterium]
MTLPAGAVALTAAMVVQATHGRLVAGPADRVFARVSTDSRATGADALFVALSGPRFDAHAFVPQAVDAGATGVVVSRQPEHALDHAVVILVDDTLLALQRLAQAVRRASHARVVAITGSAGKTTTKEVTADLLATRFRVFRNPGNLNNHIGLPLSLLELRHGPDVAVVELGMNHAGEIRRLVEIAEPQVRVWTNVGDAHLGYFGSAEAIARAKAEILEGADASTLVVANADDPLVMAHVRHAPARRVLFGETAEADVRAEQVTDAGFDGTTANVRTPRGRLRLKVRLPGRAQLANVLAAVAVAVEFGIDLADVERVVESVEAVARRGRVTRLANGARLVDDSYNASPAAVDAMLRAMAATPVAGRRIAVLGEMLELGERSRALHERCGRTAASAVASLVVIGGEPASGLVDGAIAGGLARDRILRFPDSAAAARAVASLVEPGDLVLVKGSRGTRTDIVADHLLEVA